ncbi:MULTISPECIES: hypothetical protein [Streptomyces]|uniref:Secreted protein n=1 Tax=Streptomyces doudnae TaxID=3075536 RepID=A0ABD5EMM7_9ACTN|nr:MULTISPECIES: hypothetical protein [unclassified Streptomyces]MDT0435938.1 hypothetical protein [Streptomyces sp. DSM 41981]MYQ67518.1 hypothetical protein [Streptomyces sp. SID4950]SCE36181.1 hypothetical protein GA0115242_13313 [Streptomyces sp. SolWspMP-5a-2]
MRRGLVHVLAWTLATGAAATLSWWGVHTVMAGTAYDPPRALPITAADATTQESKPLASATSRPPTPTYSPPPPARTPVATPSRPAPPSPTPTAAPTPSTSGEVKSYDTDGGRAVFDLGTASATLVSATPGSGWSMQVWKTESWIRVEFTAGADRVSVFCTWHDGPPRVEIGTY